MSIHVLDLDQAGRHERFAPVSVIVPCYRCAATIGDAVGSVASQTLRPAEVLLVEDGSGDNTLQALYDVAGSYEPGWIKVIPLEKNGGPSRARNTGWEHAAQPYVAWLDADDCWGVRKIELQMAVLEAHPDIALIAHRMLIRPRGTPMAEVNHTPQTHDIARSTMLLRNPFPTSSVIMRRDLPFRFDESFVRSEDYLLWSQILFAGHRCARVDEVLAIWNERKAGEIGLSDDFAGVHRARRDMRRKLRRDGMLSRWDCLLASTVSVATRTRRDIVLRIQRQGPYRPRA